jgi:hypothetical protein
MGNVIKDKLLDSAQKVKNIRDMINALVLTGFKQGKIEFTEEDVEALDEVTSFVLSGQLPITIPKEMADRIGDIIKADAKATFSINGVDMGTDEGDQAVTVTRKLITPVKDKVEIDGKVIEIEYKAEDLIDNGKEPQTPVVIMPYNPDDSDWEKL